MKYSLQEALRELNNPKKNLKESNEDIVTAVFKDNGFDKSEFEDAYPELMSKLEFDTRKFDNRENQLAYCDIYVKGKREDVEEFIQKSIWDYGCDTKEEAEELYGEGCIPTIINESLNEGFKIAEANLTEDDLISVSNFIKGQLLKFVEQEDLNESESGIVTEVKLSPKGIPTVYFSLMSGRGGQKREGKVSLAGVLNGKAKVYRGFNVFPPIYVKAEGSRSAKVADLMNMYKESLNKEDFISKINDKLKVRYSGGTSIYTPENLQWINDHVTRIELLIGDNPETQTRAESIRAALKADFPDVDIDEIATLYNNDPMHICAMKMTFSTKDLSTMPEPIKNLLSPSSNSPQINRTDFIWELLRDYGSDYPNLYLGFKR